MMLSPDMIPAGAKMTVWVIYDHPTDCPTAYVARPQFVMRDHGVVPCQMAWASDSLDKIREALAASGLTCLARHPDDDPKIVETWI